MLESIKELEEKKRTLEQTQDSLNEELVKLRAQGNYPLIRVHRETESIHHLKIKFSFRPSRWFII